MLSVPNAGRRAEGPGLQGGFLGQAARGRSGAAQRRCPRWGAAPRGLPGMATLQTPGFVSSLQEQLREAVPGIPARRRCESSPEVRSAVWGGCPAQGWALGAAARGASEVEVPAGRDERGSPATEPISGRCLQAKEAIAVVRSAAPHAHSPAENVFVSVWSVACAGGAAGRHGRAAAGGDISSRVVSPGDRWWHRRTPGEPHQ